YQYPLGAPLIPVQPSAFDGLVIDIRGWRKRYLLMLLIALSWLVALNVLLTLWISRAINFSFSAGAASVAIKANSLRADDVVNFLDDIAVKNIHSRMVPTFFPAPDRIDVLAESFSVHSADGRLVFRVRGQQTSNPPSEAITTAAHTLRIIEYGAKISSSASRPSGGGGVRFGDGVSLQTPTVAWGDSGGLRLESATRELRVEGPQAVLVESTEARLALEANQNLTLSSSQGKVVLSADSIHLEKLRTPLASKAGKAYGGVYQLCACASGRLFLAAPAAPCRAHNPGLCRRTFTNSSPR
ncbi:zeta-sarcoglycan-like, partial [Tropilaelaps mercedesae]